MKKLALISLLSIALSGTAISAPVSQGDMNHIFGSYGESDKTIKLSNQEMEKTEGALVQVYVLMAAGRIVYAGISSNAARRVAQHLAANVKNFDGYKVVANMMTRDAAKVVEQNAINNYNLITNGFNKINSISKNNNLFNQVYF